MARNHQVRCKTPRKVLITGGHESGGVGLFANALKEGFAEWGSLPRSFLLAHFPGAGVSSSAIRASL